MTNLWPWLILIIAYGACVGSFLNVVIYRIPVGANIITPPSACLRCGHRLAWYDNVPVLAWLWLRGRCRYCVTSISIQYPIIEVLTATLFGGLFALYYMTDLRPVWSQTGLNATWPVLLIHLALVAGLVASTVIDGKFFIIPLSIPRVLTIVAVAGLPLSVLAFPETAVLCPWPGGGQSAGPVFSWGVGAAAGGMAGVVMANVLVAIGLLPRSFTQPVLSEPEPSPAEAGSKTTDEANPQVPDEDKWNPFHGFTRECLFAAGLLAVGLCLYGCWRLAVLDKPPPQELLRRQLPDFLLIRPEISLDPRYVSVFTWQGVLVTMAIVFVVLAVATLIYLKFSGVGSERSQNKCESPENWLAHPQPRLEVLKEALFVALPVVGAVWGGLLVPEPKGGFPVAVLVLAGSIWGYLAGAAAVWFTRIAGTIAFGKEAMGLGDVHLLGAIGAVVGWGDSLVVYFMAPFGGITAVLVLTALGRILAGPQRIIPYGPYLAGAAVVVMIFGGRSILAVFGIIL